MHETPHEPEYGPGIGTRRLIDDQLVAKLTAPAARGARDDVGAGGLASQGAGVIQLRLFGTLQLSASDGRDLAALARRSKRTALLVYLAAAVPYGLHRRDTLLALFWPELDEAKARSALSQALYVLRNALGEQAIVTHGDDEVGVSHDMVWCDVNAFEAALDAGRLEEALAHTRPPRLFEPHRMIRLGIPGLSGPTIGDAELLVLRQDPQIMVMAVTIPRYTVADLERFPDDGQRYELLDGLLLVTPSPGLDHQLVATRLAAALTRALEPAGIRVVGPGVVVREPGTQLQPDVMVFRSPSPAGASWKEVEEVWLAVEVLSPGSRIYDREFKRDAYLALGVDEVWLVDLKERTVLVSRSGDARDIRVTGVLRWQPRQIDVPIELDLDRIFAELA
jgi:Uma2 family endonuclease